MAHFQALGLALRVQALDLGFEPGRLLRQQGQTVLQQLALEPGKVGPQRLAPLAPALDLGQQGLVALAIGNQRRQQLDLALGLEHGLVRAVQVVEVADQGLDAAGHIEGLQHVAAHEIGEVAHRLHRHRLMEQLQRLLVLDAEAAAKPGPVRREALEQLAARAAQLLAQAGDVAAKAAEVVGNRQRPLGRHEQARGLALRVFQPEHLGQRHGLVVALVAKHRQDDRVARRIAQRHRPAAPGDLVALALVVAQHVGAQAALAGIGPGGLVVGHALRRHQQRGDGIDQGRFARTDVAREQAVAAIELVAPDTLVEGAPIEHLQPLQPEAHPAVVGHEVQANCGRFKHRSPPVLHRARCLSPTRPCDSPPAAPQTRPATAHRQRLLGCAAPRSGCAPAARSGRCRPWA